MSLLWSQKSLAWLHFSRSEHMGIFPKHQSSWSFWNQKKKTFLSNATYIIEKGIPHCWQNSCSYFMRIIQQWLRQHVFLLKLQFWKWERSIIVYKLSCNNISSLLFNLPHLECFQIWGRLSHSPRGHIFAWLPQFTLNSYFIVDTTFLKAMTLQFFSQYLQLYMKASRNYLKEKRQLNKSKKKYLQKFK